MIELLYRNGRLKESEKFLDQVKVNTDIKIKVILTLILTNKLKLILILILIDKFKYTLILILINKLS